MKKIFCTILLALMTLLSFGQNKGAIQFLGIPVDGPKSEFETKLQAKGFTYDSSFDGYRGQFNGKNVEVYINTNHNLVDRVYVAFPATTGRKIKNEFNRLLSQFKNTEKYMDFGFNFNEEISDDEDISHEITVNNKRYEAAFMYFAPERCDSISFFDAVYDKFQGIISEEQLNLLRNYFKTAMNLSEEDRNALDGKLLVELKSSFGEQAEMNPEEAMEKTIMFVEALLDGMRSWADGFVWFMIHERRGRYHIGLYYDNLHNLPHGEDL